MACFTLARCLQLGQAITQDREQALQYYTKVREVADTRSVLHAFLFLFQAKDYDKDTVAELHTQVIHGLL